MTKLSQACIIGRMNQTAEAAVPELTLGWRLRLSLEHAGMKHHMMAKLLGVSRQTMTNWMTDEIRPKDQVLREWARITGVSLAWLAPGVPTEEEMRAEMAAAAAAERERRSRLASLPKATKGQRKSPNTRSTTKGRRKGFAVPYRNAYGGHGYSDRSAPLAS